MVIDKKEIVFDLFTQQITTWLGNAISDSPTPQSCIIKETVLGLMHVMTKSQLFFSHIEKDVSVFITTIAKK